jgi:hypothetical protein
MAKLAKMQKQYNKDQFKKMASGQSLVSDAEKSTMEGNLVSGANQVLQAQQANLGRAAQGQAAGSPLESQLRNSQTDIAKAGQDVAISAKGQSNTLVAGLEEQRKAQAMGAADREREIARQNTAQYAEMGATVGSLLLG